MRYYLLLLYGRLGHVGAQVRGSRTGPVSVAGV